MLNSIFDTRYWAAVPFHFWSLVFFAFGSIVGSFLNLFIYPLPFLFWLLVFFAFGSIVGSFLNVCIHRLPLGQSVVSPPSHCPHCKYSIPWFLNIPLVTWAWLRGKGANF